MDDRGCSARETASTHGLACGKQRRDDRWTRAAVAALNSLPKVEGCAQHLGIPVALPASAKPLAREKSERIEKCLHRNLLGKRYRCMLPSNYISCIFSIRDQPAWLSLLLFLVLLLLLTLARSALSRS